MSQTLGASITLKFGELLSFGAQKGYYSHIYAEAGFLGEDAPRCSLAYPRSAQNAVFDLASLTKALVTAPLVIEQSGEHLEEPWSSLVPDSLAVDKSLWWSKLSLSSLLSHTSGLPAWRNLWMDRLGPFVPRRMPFQHRARRILDSLARSIAEQPTEVKPCYSDLGYLLLGLMLENQCGRSLDDFFGPFADQMIGADPASLGFAHATDPWAAHYVPSSFCPIRSRLLVGEVHDENAASLGGICGHAGLFSSGPLLGKYIRKLFAGSLGQRLMSVSLHRMQDGKSPLGLRPGDDEAAQGFVKKQMTLGHWGFTGTAFWLDPSDGRYAILLSNRVLKHRILPDFKAFRREALQHLAEALETSSGS